MIRPTPSRVSDTEAQRILSMIEDGELKVGDQLPGQRELSSQLGIGRSSLREAVRSLEAVGVLETRPGLGTFVISDKPYSVVAPSLSLWLKENKAEVLKVFEVREALETKAAELAAINVSSSGIEQMSDVLRQMHEAAGNEDVKRLTELDHAFHDMISRASGNELLSHIIESIQDVLLESRRALLSLPGRARRSIQEHDNILQAMMSGDPAAAKRAMQTHLQSAVSSVDEE